MLKRHFEHEDYYIQLVELFHDVTYRTEMGQLLDLTSQPMDGPSELSRYYERAFPFIHGPCEVSVQVGMCMYVCMFVCFVCMYVLERGRCLSSPSESFRVIV